MSTRMQQRRGTAQQWTDANPVLAEGEVGFETDTYQFKIGNGVNAWASLDYFSAGTDLSAYATETYVDTAVSNIVDSAPGVLDTLNELAAAIGDDANFVTTINTTITDGDAATLASAQSYADTQDAALSATITAAYEAYADGATTDMATTTYVDDQDVATLAAANAYTDGEIAALVDSSPATLDTLNELAAALGDDANFATTVSNQIAGKADASHTHAISEVTNLQTSLDAKVNKTNPTVNAASETAYYVRNIYISSSDTPSGGNDGDLWVTWE